MTEEENVAEEEEIIILTGDDCAPCEALHRMLVGVKAKVNYRFVDVNSEEGQAIIKEGTEQLTLPLALRVKKTVKIEECEIFQDKDTVLIKDKKGNITPLREAAESE